MIYQLKVTLQDSKPPIWRRLLVHADITFYQLHKIIQIAFQWGDYHLHEFHIRKIPQDQRRRFDNIMYLELTGLGVSIGVPDDDDEFGGLSSSPPPLDERKEVLATWLRQEKDRMLYTYDFGDNWEHTIVLEKILEESPDQPYPCCLKVRGLAPQEDSRFMMLDGIPFEEAPADFITMVNEELQESEIPLKPSATRRSQKQTGRVSGDASTSSAQEGDSWHTLFTLAKEFLEIGPWDWMYNDQIFAVHDALSGKTGYCIVLGNEGELYGLVINRGEQGHRGLHQVLAEDLTSGTLAEEYQYSQDAIVLSYVDREDLFPEEYRLIRSSGVKFRGRLSWPSIHDRRPSYVTDVLPEEERGFMIRVLQQAIEVCDKVLKQPSLLDTYMEKGLYYARISDIQDGEILWREGSVSAIPEEERYEEQLALSEFELASLRKRANRVGMELEYDIIHLPVWIEDERGGRPYHPLLGVGMHIGNEMLIPPAMAHPTTIYEDLQRGLFGFFRSINTVPDRIIVQRPRALHLLRPLCQALDIELWQVRELKLLNEAKKDLIHHFQNL